MKKTVPLMVVTLFSASSMISASGLKENKVISDAGFSTLAIEVPLPGVPAAPETKNNQQNTALRKIKLNEAQPDMNDTLTARLVRHTNINKVVRELNADGFKARACRNNNGGCMIMVDVTGVDAADSALGLAKYYYVAEVLVGQKVYDRLFNVKAKSSYAVKIGAIKGGANHSPVDIAINKIDWTVKGGANHSPVDIKIDHEAKTITGGANHSPVNLKFAWSTEDITVEGGANHSPVKYTVDWKNGLLEGYMNHAPLKLKFDMQEGVADAVIVRVAGYVNHAPVDLTYNKINGHIGGGMNRSPVNLTLTNCDLYDFLTYFFIFAK
ncbi:MAG: hypothetical protein HY796_03970 [Elusimicrobia bacterium]|nr:hypothetical protein [Elusimicrobiota bacterium]